jgi:hypothetical protein
MLHATQNITRFISRAVRVIQLVPVETSPLRPFNETRWWRKSDLGRAIR